MTEPDVPPDLVAMHTEPAVDSDPIGGEAGRRELERARLQTDAVGGSFWIAVQVLLGLPLAVVANAVVARQLGAQAYGTLAVDTLVFGVATALINLGISDATVQWIATHAARAEVEETVLAIRRCSGFHVMVEAPLFAVLAAVLLHNAGPGAMVFGAVSAAAVEVVGTSTVVMSGAGLNALSARIALAATAAGQITIIAVAHASPVASSVFAGRLALGLMGPAAALALIPRVYRRAVLSPMVPRRFPLGFLSFAIRTCAAGVVSSLVFGRPELLLFDAYGRTQQAGLFALVAGVAGLLTSPIDSLLGPLLPAATGLLAISPERARSALLRGLRTSGVLAGLVAAIGIPVLAPLLTVFYGKTFRSATAAFVILAVVSCVQSVSHPIQAFLMAARRTGMLLAVAAVSVVVDAAVAAATIPFLGVLGGVAASTVAQLGTLVVIAVKVGTSLGASAAEQARQLTFLPVAAAAGGAALAVQGLADALPAVGRALLGGVVAVAAIAILNRVWGDAGFDDADLAVIDGGLPRPLRPVLHLVTKVLALRRIGPSAGLTGQ